MITGDERSCRWVDFPMSRKTKLCGGVSHVSIAFPTTDDENLFDTSGMRSLVAISFEFDMNGDNCYIAEDFANKQQAMMKTEYEPTIAKAFGMALTNIVHRFRFINSRACPPWSWYDSKCDFRDGTPRVWPALMRMRR
jgi:hypothetical protein